LRAFVHAAQRSSVHGNQLFIRRLTMYYSHREYSRLAAAHSRVAEAQQDYDRLREAYLEVVKTDPYHEVALALLGDDLDRAHAALQSLLGVEPPAGSPPPSRTLRRSRGEDAIEG